MDLKRVEEALARNIGPRRNTLRLTGNAKGNTNEFFYTDLPRDKEDEIVSIINTLKGLDEAAKKNFTELTALFDPRKRPDLYRGFIAAQLKRHGIEWVITFFPLVGYKIHRSYNHTLCASLLIGKPLVEIDCTLGPEGYGLFDRHPIDPENYQAGTHDGLSYRVNRLLVASPAFRGFMVSFMEELARTTQNGIFKDMARTIDKEYCCLVSLPYNVLKKEIHTPRDLLRHFVGIEVPIEKLSINPNRLTLNEAFLIAKLAKMGIHDKDWVHLQRIAGKNMSKYLVDCLACLYGNIQVNQILGALYLTRFEEEDPGQQVEDVEDRVDRYYALSHTCGSEVRLGYSMDQLETRIDELEKEKFYQHSRALKGKVIVAVNSRFDGLFDRLCETLSGEIQRVTTEWDLIEIGKRQHNCLAVDDYYQSLIIDDKAMLIEWTYQKKEYSISVKYRDDECYYLSEMYARFNEDPEESVKDMILEQILLYNRMIEATCN